MNCRVCDSTALEMVLDLGLQPWGNDFLRKEDLGRESRYPLRLFFCRDCSTSQIDHTVKKEVMFGDHTYRSGITRSLSEHFRHVAEDVDRRFFTATAPKAALDIGSNDGTQLKHFQALGYDVLGIESSRNTAEAAVAAGVPTLNRFFNLDAVRSLGRRFDVINAAGVFFHMEELHSAAEGIREGLKENGVFVVQFLYMRRIIENLAFDQIYHEHLLYYTLRTIGTLLRRHGLEMFDAEVAPIHGGSVIGFVGHPGRRPPSARLQELLASEDASGCNDIARYLLFADRVRSKKDENLGFLRAAKSAGKRIFGFGAPIKGNTLLSYFGLGPDTIECLVEKNELRRGLYTPGTHIPIVLESEVREPPDLYYVLAWNFKREILANNGHLLARGVEFFFPVEPKEE